MMEKNSVEESMHKQRLYSIDLLKIVSFVLIFLFHCNIYLGVHFLAFTPFISQGAIVIDLFFMISGFVCCYTYQSKEPWEMSSIVDFYVKRFATIYPLYLCILIIYLVIGTEPVATKMITLPVELTLLQSWFSGTFSYSHNDGTWFISCLVACYAVYPLIQMFIRKLNKAWSMIWLVILYILCASIPMMVWHLGIPDVYANPILRLMQFTAGALLTMFIKRNKKSQAVKGIVLVSSLLLLVYEITCLTQIGFGIENYVYVVYGYFTFIIFCLIIVCSVNLELSADIERCPCFNNKTISMITNISQYAYSIFMAQFFVRIFTQKIVYTFPDFFGTYANWKKIICATLICAVIAVLFREVIEKKCYRAIISMYYRRKEIREQ